MIEYILEISWEKENSEYLKDLIKANERAIRKYDKILKELKKDLRKKKEQVRVLKGRK